MINQTASTPPTGLLLAMMEPSPTLEEEISTLV